VYFAVVAASAAIAAAERSKSRFVNIFRYSFVVRLSFRIYPQSMSGNPLRFNG
jgi:hypothetical protein